jgi:hypothetical protein
MYAKISNNEIIQYPANPRTDNHNVSFAVNWNGGTISENTYVTVKTTEPPTTNLGWICTETTPVKIDNSWQQSWSTSLVSKENLKKIITSKRYEVEVGNVRINKNLYSTDRESQTKYVAIAVDIAQSSNVSVWHINWKTADGIFVNLNATEMNQVVNGVRQHVQSCFDKESEYYTLIDTADQATLEATDFSSGWPSNT